MKKLTLIFAVACLLFSCSNEKTFKISGTLTDFGNTDEPTMLYLKTRTATDELINVDSTFVSKQGSFVLKGKSTQTDLYFLADKDNVFLIRVFVDPGDKITISGEATDAPNVKVQGSKTHELYKTYLSLLVPIQNKQKEIEQEYYTYQNMDISEAEFQKMEEELIAKYEQLREDETNITVGFIKDNATSLVAAYLVYRSSVVLSSSAEIEEQLQWLDPALDNKFITLTKARIEKIKLTEVGSVLPNIELPDADNSLISLETLRGKYVLVDFWASWCGPCVKETPNLKKAYSKYHDKGFEIYSISLDHEKSEWTHSIEKLELNWLHVSDLKAFNSPVAKQIAVSYVPHTFLLDPNGVIIAVDLREDALENKLAELLK